MSNAVGTTPGSDAQQSRAVLIHYHLFKNAGTSVDRALKALYGVRWTSIEAQSGDKELPPERIQALIDRSPDIVAISSHTARIEPWALHNVTVFPLVFVRHPIDRMMSAYEFERNQPADTLGARKAKELTFREYVDFFVNTLNARTFRNFHSHRISRASQKRDLPEVERALDALESLPFVGVVEEYEASIRYLERQAQPLFPDLKLTTLRANAGSRSGSIEAKLAEIRHQLGPELYDAACERNLRDLVIWERAQRILARVEQGVAKG